MPTPIRILDQPHRAAQTLLASGAPVFMGVNPVEYHGPHLSLHNDRLITEATADLLHGQWSRGRDWPYLVVDDLELGVDPTSGPGTRVTPFVEARRVIVRACNALAELGARRVVLGTFHGAPLHTAALDAGVVALSRRGVAAFAPMHLLLARLAGLDPADYPELLASVPDASDRDWLRARFAWDFHAGFLETSLSLHLAPESVAGHQDVPPCPEVLPAQPFAAAAAAADRLGRSQLARELRVAAWSAAWFALRPFPGYTSAPHLATAAAGEYLLGQVLPEVATTGLDVLEGRRPHPEAPMQWVTRATMGGRLGDIRAPDDAVARTQ
ncbi:MAG: creatininase family protein [Deltaproteobacteria bacterium]|nr:creatininase family protein [Deltaproteobacteria bacterium]